MRISKLKDIKRKINKFIFENSFYVVKKKNFYLLQEAVALKQFIEHFKVDCIFDIGANNGQYAKFLRRDLKYKGLIFSFEPIPQLAKNLKDMSKNDSNWHVEQVAVSSENSKKKFNIMRSSTFSSFSSPRHDQYGNFKEKNIIEDTIMVNTETLSSIFLRAEGDYSFKRPFLKMDTQGHDVEVFLSGANILSNIIGVQSELSVKKIYESSADFKEVISIYDEYGFDISSFIPNNQGHFPVLVEIDGIFHNRNFLKGL
jgi:FkbM family methyltransferase